MDELEQIEFKRMLAVSSALHLVVVGLVLVSTHIARTRYLEAAVPGPMSVMWARTVVSPPQSAANKLPGPIVVPQMTAPAPAKPKFVLPDEKGAPKKAADKSIDAEEDARRKAMADALASIQQDSEKRPMPKADNFPSGKPGAEEGLPAGPTGIAGILGGDPRFGSYKGQIQKIITDQFVWIQRSGEGQLQLVAEVMFQVDAAGAVLDPSVATSSGNFAFDAAALRAVRKASPLPQPPAEFASDMLNEKFVIRFAPKPR